MNVKLIGQNNWLPKKGNSAWQRERMRGPILPMEQPRRKWWNLTPKADR